MRKISIEELIALVPQYSIAGDPSGKYFTNIKVINEANQESLVWVSPLRKDKQQLLDETLADIIICDSSVDVSRVKDNGKCCLIVDNPKLIFLRIASEFFSPKIVPGIHPSAVIHPDAVIAEGVYIGPNSSIGACIIGAGSVIHGNCHLYSNVTVGKHVTINAGTVIGADGFGYSKNEQGEFEKFPHIGGVVIEDNVEIGANTCIDKGTLGNTLIRKGAKIDNLVHIAHNVVVGQNSVVIALAMIGGSTVIEDNVWVAPASAIRDGIIIGANSTVGMGAIVTKPIPVEEVWIGNPAKKMSK
ncbi:UDP-3-O-(3-hydroxymyristoyl)glucosamine N-acyltransferase [Taibaiella helva]|uniref:UDP-3-O-(3-hydroxymyristoyl)glucosamine N-acyltransferase n=1 Tax=Taibaiella helva TaxID=2301235 RepID=UPI000E575194|nr:UDP-3-O-(3-hydroxymyristoyl)glucosamine N-acyltransferase [Taibaiella helva]